MSAPECYRCARRVPLLARPYKVQLCEACYRWADREAEHWQAVHDEQVATRLRRAGRVA